jgi:hypothetical protein
MKRILVIIIIAVALLSFAASSPTSAANGLSWTVVSLNAIGCNSGAINFTTVLAGYTGGPERFRTIVDAGGLRYMDEDAGTPGGGNGNYGWSLYTSNSGGPITGTFPIPPDTPIRVHFMLIDGVGGPAVFENVVYISRCNGGHLGLDPGPDMVPIPDTAVVGSFVVTTAGYGEPNFGSPSNFVMEAGKTVWVFGVDATGNFYKVMLSGRFFWVPVETMGPNYDAVWNGRPLPTEVVE